MSDSKIRVILPPGAEVTDHPDEALARERLNLSMGGRFILSGLVIDVPFLTTAALRLEDAGDGREWFYSMEQEFFV